MITHIHQNKNDKLCQTTFKLLKSHLAKDKPEWFYKHGWILNRITYISIHMYLVRWYFVVKYLPQMSHLNGFSPVWVITCFLRLDLYVKALPQMSHLNGFSPVWVITCFLRTDFSEKGILQISQEKYPFWKNACACITCGNHFL